MVKPVGYKSPPDHTKWIKGQSGNPSGRKKGHRNLKTELSEELNERIRITEGGRIRSISKQRALLKALVAIGLKGDVRAATAVLAMYARELGAELPEAVELPASDRQILDDFVEEEIQRRAAAKNVQGENR